MDTLINWTIVPVANAIGRAAENGGAVPFLVLVSSDRIRRCIDCEPGFARRDVGMDPEPAADSFRWSSGSWLLLPVVAGLWVWETSWPFLVRLVLVGGLAFWNIVMFLPKALQAAPH